MNRHTVALAVVAIALGGCATYGPGYTYGDGSNAGAYNDGSLYVASQGGYGDYYYDNGYPDYYYGPYGGYGFGYPSWGFGYDPWFYGGCCYGYHRWRGDHDGDDWHHHRHWSGQGPWPHAVSAGHAPRGWMPRGDSDRHPQPRWTRGPKP